MELSGRVFFLLGHLIPLAILFLLLWPSSPLPLPFPTFTTFLLTFLITFPLALAFHHLVLHHLARTHILGPITKKFKPSVPLHEWPKSYAMVTGASGGLGLEYARLLAADGYNLVLVARSEDKLEEVKKELVGKHGINVKIIAKDLTLPNAAWEVFDEVRKESFLIELLVNNAGVGVSGPFTSVSLEQTSKLLQLNVVALTELTYLMVKRMLTEGDSRGKIMNLASCAGFVPGPYMSIYYASKAYVISFTEALNYELRNTEVTAVAVCPGATATNFAKIAGNENSGLFTYSEVMNAADVARLSYRAWMQGGETVITPGFRNWISSVVAPLLPRAVLLPMVALLNRSAK